MENNNGTGSVAATPESAQSVDSGTSENVQSGSSFDDIQINLDEFVSAEFEDPIMQGEHRGLPSYNEVLKHIPENGRKIIQNLRSLTTKRTQELAEMKRQLEDERAEVMRERQAMYNGDFAKQINAKASEQVDDLDLYSDEGLQKKMDIEIAKKMQELIRPLQDELHAKQRDMELNKFKADHPDLTSDEIKPKVVELLMQRAELSLEDAYYIVKAKVDGEKLSQIKAQENSKKQSQRDAFNKTSSGAKVDSVKPGKKLSAWDHYQLLKSQQGKK
jgi:hypothetical protein